MHVTSRLSAVFLLTMLCSCTEQHHAADPQYEVVTDMHHTMVLIIDPAADLIWSSAGSIVTDVGEHDLAPATDHAWFEVEVAAALLAESGNLLMMPGRSAGEDWDEHSRDLIRAGKMAMTAAQQQDAEALFDSGGLIYQACLACHSQYLVGNGAR